MTPPAIEHPRAGELWNLGKLGRSFRGLGKQDAYRLLRWGPMAVADLVAEWFETETMRAIGCGAWNLRRVCRTVVSQARVPACCGKQRWMVTRSDRLHS